VSRTSGRRGVGIFAASIPRSVTSSRMPRLASRAAAVVGQDLTLARRRLQAGDGV
jgi:hypothetical protein